MRDIPNNQFCHIWQADRKPYFLTFLPINATDICFPFIKTIKVENINKESSYFDFVIAKKLVANQYDFQE